jgi:hypothetical protein
LPSSNQSARTPAQRAKDGTLGPVPLQVLKAWRCAEPRRLEQLVLRRLAPHRCRGEWLTALTVDDVEAAVHVTASANGIELSAQYLAGPSGRC